jgi:hypothetical protein
MKSEPIINLTLKSKSKSIYRIVPTVHEKMGSCWALKDGNVIVGTFASKRMAEKRKLQLEAKTLEDFSLITQINQELKLEE